MHEEDAIIESDEDAAAPVEYAWRVHPARTNMQRTVLGAAVIVVVGAAVAGLSIVEGVAAPVAIVLGLVACAVLVLALHKFFFPSRFEIDREGITARHFLSSRRMEWKDARRFLHDADGGYLSMRARRNALDAWQGMHLIFSEDRDRAIEEIQSRVHHGEKRFTAETAEGRER